MNRLHQMSLACTALLTMSCATARPPVELVDARNAYTEASRDATRAAPTELHDARMALDRAESVFASSPESIEVKDRSYVAQRRSQLASARAATFIANEQKDASNIRLRALGSAAATALNETRDDLSAAQKQARASASDVSGLKKDLKVSQSKADGLSSDLKDSESKASDLTSDLKVSEVKADALKTQLAEEKEARKVAEARLTATLQAMQNLQAVKEEPRGLVITLSGAVLFASSKSVLLGPARAALDNVAEALKASPDRSITVEGHTDSQGGQASNMTLSQSRGESVRAYLVSRGIPAANITSAGFGSQRPIADNGTAEGRANNRRVEIILAPVPEAR